MNNNPPITDQHRQDNVGSILRRSAGKYSNQPAFEYEGITTTYGDFNEYVNRFANGLREIGVSKDDKVAVLAGNSVKYLTTWFGAAKIGVIHVPLHGELASPEYDFYFDKVEPDALIIEDEFLDKVGDRISEWDVECIPFSSHLDQQADRSRFPEQDPQFLFSDLIKSGSTSEPEVDVDKDDVAQILFTSGTTGDPKGAMLTHYNLVSQYSSCIVGFELERDDRSLACMPMFHVAQLQNFTTPDIYQGAFQVIKKDFNPQDALETIEEKNITRLFCLPQMYRAMLNQDDFDEYDLSSLRLCIYAMQPMTKKESKEMAEQFGAQFTIGFGQTEMSSATTLSPPDKHDEKAGSVGTPVLNVEMGIMDGEGNLVPSGEVGEIVYRGSQVMAGYYDEPELTEEVFRNDWLHSGDMGYVDEDDYLWFVDRKKDIIKTGGENVPSIEVEEVLLDCPSIDEVAVVGLPHEKWNEAITAFVRSTDDLLESDVIQFCEGKIAGFKIPKAIVFTSNLPSTASGKIQKAQLRDQYSEYYG